MSDLLKAMAGKSIHGCTKGMEKLSSGAEYIHGSQLPFTTSHAFTVNKTIMCK